MHPVEIRLAKLIYSTFAQQDLVLFTLFEHAFKVWQKKKKTLQHSGQESNYMLIWKK